MSGANETPHHSVSVLLVTVTANGSGNNDKTRKQNNKNMECGFFVETPKPNGFWVVCCVVFLISLCVTNKICFCKINVVGKRD